MRFLVSVLALGLAQLALSQDLQESLTQALANYSETTVFQSLFGLGDDVLGQVLGDKESDLTLLIPDNDALTTYLEEAGIDDPTTIPLDTLVSLLKYHVLSASLMGDDLNGVTVPTLLMDEQYNDREAGDAITSLYGEDATGQVVYIAKDGNVTNVRSGMGMDSEVDIVDGTWGTDGTNYFQILKSVLTLPASTSETASGTDALSSLVSALTTAELVEAVDSASNITVLAPSNDAFTAADNPQDSLDAETLGSVLTLHVLTETAYSTYLADGQEFETLSGDMVTVRIIDGNVYFNNAMVVAANVITSNGVVHVLDSIIEKDGTPEGTSEDDEDDDDSDDDDEEEPTTIPEGSAVTLARGGSVVAAFVVAIFLM